MMISPDGYNEVCLKGKSKQEILEEIKILKQEVKELRERVEDPEKDPDKMLPSALTKLKCSREYLSRAIQAYEEAGGTYILTKEEKKSRDFDVALDSMEKLVFSIGGFFGGFETRTCTISGDAVSMNTEHSLIEISPNVPDHYAYTKTEFIDALKELHIGEWKSEYDNPYVLDGEQWNLEIYFAGKRKPVEKYGSNAYPYNFADLKELLWIYEEPDEEPDGEQDWD